MKEIFSEIEGKFSESGLLEIFPDVIKSIITNEAGFIPGYQPETALDLNSFEETGNTVNGSRKDWKCAATVNNIYSGKLLSELAKESALILIPDYRNRIRMITLEEKETGKIISINDINTDKKGIPVISITKTPLNNIRNSFSIRYCYDYYTDDFLKTEFLNSDSSSLSVEENSRSGIPGTYTGFCAESRERFGKNYEYIIEAKHIRERATAIGLMKWYASWYSKRRILLNIGCLVNSNTISLETGDLVKINIDLLPDSVRNSHKFIIYSMETEYWKGFMNLKMMEMSEPE